MCSIENKIRSKIKENNFIRIDEFMNICLSDKEDGYYVKKTPIGSLGDFTTSPEISQLFGEIVALFIVNSINNNFSDIDKIQLIEIGAGKGTLADDVLRTLSKFPQIFKKISFVIIEISEELKKHQKAKLLKHNIDISWQENFHNLPNIPTVIYYPKPLHVQEGYKHFPKVSKGLPNSDILSKRVFSIPMHPYIKRDQVDRICNSLKTISIKE